MARPKKEKPNRVDGTYEVKVTVGKTITGKLIRKSFYSTISKADAKKKGQQYIIEREVAIQTEGMVIDSSITFARWADRWLETYKKPNVDENTYLFTYKNSVEKHLKPYFGNMKLIDIRPIHIQEFFTEKNQLSASMLSKMKICLNGIFETAIENDLLIKNPSKAVTFASAREKNKKQVYTDEEISLVEQQALEAGFFEVVILLETGMRRGELLGLTWDDIDFEHRAYSVRRSIADQYGGGIRINAPKWRSYRTNPLSDRAMSVLNMIPQRGEYIFPNLYGQPQSPNTWAQKLERFMDNLPPDIPRLTAHELRHTYGTWLRRRGVDIYAIQKIMGHKDIRVTTEIYVHNELDTLKKSLRDCLGSEL